MIKPHGSDDLNALYVADDTQRATLLREAEGLPSLLLNSAAAGQTGKPERCALMAQFFLPVLSRNITFMPRYIRRLLVCHLSTLH